LLLPLLIPTFGFDNKTQHTSDLILILGFSTFSSPLHSLSSLHYLFFILKVAFVVFLSNSWGCSGVFGSCSCVWGEKEEVARIQPVSLNLLPPRSNYRKWLWIGLLALAYIIWSDEWW